MVGVVYYDRRVIEVIGISLTFVSTPLCEPNAVMA